MPSRGCAAFSFLAPLIVALVPFTATAQIEIESNASATRTFTITVMDASGTPLPETDVNARVGTERLKLKTDAVGQVTLPVSSPQPEYVSITVPGSAGHVGMSASWANTDERQEVLPESHTFTLPAAHAIGGVVTDPEGKPVPGVRVYLLLVNNSQEQSDRLYVDGNRPIAETDAKGRWSYAGAPAELTDFWMRAIHSDFVGDNYLKPSPEELYAKTAVIELKRGLTISGHVVDQQGKSIPRARIYEGLWSSGTAGSSAVADENGKFTLKNLKEMRAVMTVQAEGYAPTMVVKTLKEKLKPAEITLEPGRTLKLKVVDTHGKPLSGVGVATAAWRGGESLRTWPLVTPKTDADGMVVWDSAPTDAVDYSVYAKGLFPSAPVNVIADGEVHTVVMRKPFLVSGTAVDAKTAQPVDKYRVFPILCWKSGGTYISRRDEVDVTDGRFEYDLTRLDCDHGVRVEAEGYRPITTPAFDLSGDGKAFSFELIEAPNIEGVLHDTEGRPVPSAQLAVCGANDQINIQNGHIDVHFSGLNVMFDPTNGQFKIPPQDGPYVVVAAAATGYAEATGEEIERTGKLVLQPWGEIRGTLVRNGGAVSAVPIYLSRIRMRMWGYPIINDTNYTQTATDGSFSFGRVPPGSVLASANVSPWEQTALTSGERAPVDVQPGESIELDFGSTGTSVIGRLALPKGDKREMAWNWALNYMYRKAPGVPMPEEVRNLGFSHEDGWNEAWVSTPEGRAFFDTLEGHFVKLTPDGEFRVDGVKPGDYKLAFRLYDEPEGTCMVSPIGTATFDVTVPENSKAGSELDLGTLIVEVYPELKVGDPAPEFDVANLSGGMINLKDLRGKYVLLDFWATWCGPCRGIIANLKAVQEKFGSRPDFVILSLSLDSAPDAARQMVAEQGMGWLQGHLGDWSDTDLTYHYNVSGIPATFLIGPDGKLIARDLFGHTIQKAVEDALAKK